MTPPGFGHCSHDLEWGLERTAVRPSGPVVERARAFGLIALDPRVAGFPADVETLLGFDQIEQMAAVVGNELDSLIHRRALALKGYMRSRKDSSGDARHLSGGSP
jgi:hypothetical protein